MKNGKGTTGHHRAVTDGPSPLLLLLLAQVVSRGQGWHDGARAGDTVLLSAAAKQQPIDEADSHGLTALMLVRFAAAALQQFGCYHFCACFAE